MAAFRLRGLGLLALAATEASSYDPSRRTYEPWKTTLPRLIKQNAECMSTDRYLENSNSYLDCAKTVGGKGGHYFSYGKAKANQPTPPPAPRVASSDQVADSLHVTVMQNAFQLMKVGGCYLEYNYEDSCPQGFKTGDFDFFALDEYEVTEDLLNPGQDCQSKKKFLGRFNTPKDCAEAVLAVPDGQFFIYGNGKEFISKGECYIKWTKTHKCTEGFTPPMKPEPNSREGGPYDFYGLQFKLVRNASDAADRRRRRDRRRRQEKQKSASGNNQGSGGYVGTVGKVSYETIRSDVECKGDDEYMGWYTTKEGCMQAVKDKGGKYASYGKGMKMWLCYKEKTSSADCPEGFEKDNFDFVGVVQDNRRLGDGAEDLFV